jgi:hypothetical protein
VAAAQQQAAPAQCHDINLLLSSSSSLSNCGSAISDCGVTALFRLGSCSPRRARFGQPSERHHDRPEIIMIDPRVREDSDRAREFSIRGFDFYAPRRPSQSVGRRPMDSDGAECKNRPMVRLGRLGVEDSDSLGQPSESSTRSPSVQGLTRFEIFESKTTQPSARQSGPVRVRHRFKSRPMACPGLKPAP